MAPVKSPLVFFAKEAFQLRQGKKCIFVSAIWGIVTGCILPLGVASFIGKIGTQDIIRAATVLIILFLLVGAFRWYQERVFFKTLAEFKKRGRETIAQKIAKSPFTITDDASKTIVARFLSAQHAGIAAVNEAAKLGLSIVSFIAMFLLYGVPWWVYILVIGVLVVLVGGYWSIKKFALFQQAVDKESRVGDIIAELRDARNNRQVHPALIRTIKKANQEAFELRLRVNKHTLTRYVDVRNLVNTVISCAAIVAACVTDNTETATLLVVFMFTFNSHVEAIHSLASRIDTIETDGEPLLRTATQPEKPLLYPQQSNVCLRTSEVIACYPGKDDMPGKQVPVRNLELQTGGVYIFTGENGQGKSSLFKAIVAEVDLIGHLTLWGQPARDFDCSVAVNSFQQIRSSLSPTCKESFEDEQGNVDHQARAYALWIANANSIDLAQSHRKLSGGQQQKIDLALLVYRTIVMADYIGLIIIDEPTNNLDRPTVALLQERLVKFIIKHVRPTTTVLIATHDEKLQKALLELSNSQEVK